MAVPIQLIAGTDDAVVDLAFLRDVAAVVDLAFLRHVAEAHAHVSLAVWPDAEHELPLTHPVACVPEIEQLRASLMRGPAG
ncbi:MAG: hypothetical protein M3P53_12165 [Actinomycetota bacterium]|nr:hypothetical protein [Actinomycetota bacterium]